MAISNQRLVRIEGERVVFHYKDYRADGQVKETALDGVEFIPRLLLHILPQGFQRIRSYGLLANRHRSQNQETCRELPGQDSTPSNTEVPSDRQGASEVEVWRPHCKVCEVGLLVVVETFAAPPDGQPTPESRAPP